MNNRIEYNASEEEDDYDSEEEDFEVGVLTLALSIKQHGARDMWIALKSGYPEEYKQMLYYALDMLPK